MREGILEAQTVAGELLSGAMLVGVLLPFVGAEGELAWVRLADVQADEKAADVHLYTLDLRRNAAASTERGIIAPVPRA